MAACAARVRPLQEDIGPILHHPAWADGCMGPAGLPGLMPGCFGLLGLAVWAGVLKGMDDFDVLRLTRSTLWRGRRIVCESTFSGRGSSGLERIGL